MVLCRSLRGARRRCGPSRPRVRARSVSVLASAGELCDVGTLTALKSRVSWHQGRLRLGQLAFGIRRGHSLRGLIETSTSAAAARNAPTVACSRRGSRTPHVVDPDFVPQFQRGLVSVTSQASESAHGTPHWAVCRQSRGAATSGWCSGDRCGRGRAESSRCRPPRRRSSDRGSRCSTLTMVHVISRGR